MHSVRAHGLWRFNEVDLKTPRLIHHSARQAKQGPIHGAFDNDMQHWALTAKNLREIVVAAVTKRGSGTNTYFY